jgi:type I restriction enzyme S subunit
MSERRRLKQIANIRFSSVDKKSVEDERVVRLCNYTDVYYNQVVTADLSFMEATATNDQVTRFGLLADDVLITKDSETAEDIAIAAYVPDNLPGVLCGYHLAIIRPRHGTDGKYLFWSLASRPSREQFTAAATGVTRFGLRLESVGDVLLPAPPLPVQRAIADYLDTETARIDALIEKKRRMVELLEDHLWSLVSETLPSSLDSTPLRRALLSITDGPFGSALTSRDYAADGDVRVVRLGNIGRAGFLDQDRAFLPSQRFEELRKHQVAEGDLLIAGLGDERHAVGRACVAPDLGKAIVKADCYCGKVNNDRAEAPFLAWYLSSPQGAEQIARIGRGSTRMRINLDIAKAALVPLPDLETQRELVRRWTTERERVEAAATAVVRQIDLLVEHRQALITAAVTGAIDIPEVAA